MSLTIFKLILLFWDFFKKVVILTVRLEKALAKNGSKESLIVSCRLKFTSMLGKRIEIFKKLNGDCRTIKYMSLMKRPVEKYPKKHI